MFFKLIESISYSSILQEHHGFVLRFEKLDEWPEDEKRSNFLGVIAEAVSFPQSEFATFIQNLLLKVIEGNLLPFIIKNHISEKNVVNAQLVDHFIRILCTCFEVLPMRMDKHSMFVELVQFKLNDKIIYASILESTKKNLERLGYLFNVISFLDIFIFNSRIFRLEKKLKMNCKLALLTQKKNLLEALANHRKISAICLYNQHRRICQITEKR